MSKKMNTVDAMNYANKQFTVGRGPKESGKKKITLSITQEDSDVVKMYALKNHTTVSNLLHEWIVEKCGN